MAVADWMKSPVFLANAGHVMLGGIVTLVTALFTHNWLYLGVIWGALALYVGVKEYYFDLKYESDETLGSSTIDALGYVVGATLSGLLVLLAQHLGTW